MNTRRHNLFKSYSSLGMLCGAVAGICFACQGINTWWALSFPKVGISILGFMSLLGLPLFLLIPGTILHRSRGMMLRLFVGTIFGAVLFAMASCWYKVNYSGGPPIPWPDFEIFGKYYLIAAVVNAFVGTIFLSGIRGNWKVKLTSPLIGGVVLHGIGWISYLVLPKPVVVYLRPWEFATIVFGFPLFGLAVWGLFDITPRRRKLVI